VVVFLETNIVFANYTLHILSLRLCIPDFNVLKKKNTIRAVITLRMSQLRERENDISCAPSNNNKYKHVSYRCSSNSLLSGVSVRSCCCSNSLLSGVSVRSCCDIRTSLNQMAGRSLGRLFCHWKPSQHNAL